MPATDHEETPRCTLTNGHLSQPAHALCEHVSIFSLSTGPIPVSFRGLSAESVNQAYIDVGGARQAYLLELQIKY